MDPRLGFGVVDAVGLAALAAACLGEEQVPALADRLPGWAARVYADLRLVGSGAVNPEVVAARRRLERLARWAPPAALVPEQLVLPGLGGCDRGAVSLTLDG